MKKRFIIFAILIFFIIILLIYFYYGKSLPENNLVPGNEIVLSGIIISNTITSPVDGPDIIEIKTDNSIITVKYNYGEYPQCVNNKIWSLASKLTKGEKIEVFGNITSSKEISTCDSEKYYIRKI